MSEQQHKLNEFEPVSYAAWRELVEKDLKGAPFEKKLVKRVAGIDIEPLYVPGQVRPDAAGYPGFAPFARGSFPLVNAEMGWDVRQEIASSTPEQAAQAALDELNGGATSLLLRIAHDSERGIAVTNLRDLERVLEHVALERVPVSLEAGPLGLEAAAALVALARARGTKLEALHGCLGLDPLATLATEGALSCTLDSALQELASAARFARAHLPGMRAGFVNTSPYHDAGADAAGEIAYALATGLIYLRALTAAGMSVSDAAKQLTFGFSVGRDFFVEIAKLRAARATWARVVEACGGDASAQAMLIHARTSFRTKTQRDPWVNLLRATAETFSAAAAGVEVITTSPFDCALGESDEFARRLARNIQHLLRYESSLHKVADPAGGSYYVETITEALAKKAWEKLQALESAGGMAQALVMGAVQKELVLALEAERRAVETRKIAITGVNEFPHVGEEPVTRPLAALTPSTASKSEKVGPFRREQLFEEVIAALSAGASFAAVRAALITSAPAQCAALTRERLAEPFERLRDAADRALAQKGTRPSVFLANLGPIAEHKARANFAQNFFEAGGFRVLTNDGFSSAKDAAAAFSASGAELACLCASDATYVELAESTAKALADAGAKAVVLAGAPGDKEAAYRAAGVTDFIFLGTNAYAALRSLLERVGAL